MELVESQSLARVGGHEIQEQTAMDVSGRPLPHVGGETTIGRGTTSEPGSEVAVAVLGFDRESALNSQRDWVRDTSGVSPVVAPQGTSPCSGEFEQPVDVTSSERSERGSDVEQTKSQLLPGGQVERALEAEVQESWERPASGRGTTLGRETTTEQDLSSRDDSTLDSFRLDQYHLPIR